MLYNGIMTQTEISILSTIVSLPSQSSLKVKEDEVLNTCVPDNIKDIQVIKPAQYVVSFPGFA